MANTDSPLGFVPLQHAHGGCIRMTEYHIADDYGTSIFMGDPVKMVGTDRNVEQAAAGDSAIGVFSGCQWIAEDGEVKYGLYWPASTSIKSGTKATAWVVDDPYVEFMIQCDGAFAVTDIGQDSDWVLGSGNTTTGRSTAELDSSEIAQSGKDGLLIRGLWDHPENEADTNAKVVVRFSEHQLLTGSYTAV